MRIWIVKAIVQKFISFLPFSHAVNYFFQRYITKGAVLTDYLMEDKLIHCKNHLQYFNKYVSEGLKENFNSLEIGTGWFPIVPIGLYLNGASEILTVDITPLLKKSNVITTIEKFIAWRENGKLKEFLPDADKSRLARLDEILQSAASMPLDKILADLNIKPLIADARNLPLQDESIVFITSNNTFEHIPPAILEDILKEFKRIARKGGLMSHFVDMSDHFAHLDKSISIYNYMRYSEKQWQRIDNNVQPQNRLRIGHYRNLYQAASISITEEINRPGNPEELRNIKIDEAFEQFPMADNAISHTLLISKM